MKKSILKLFAPLICFGVITANLTACDSDPEQAEETGGSETTTAAEAVSQSVPKTTTAVETESVQTTDSSEVMRESFIAFTIPDAVSGEFQFERYVDGELEKTTNLDVGLTKGFKWEFSNSGNHDYTVIIKNLNNGKEGLYCEYNIDFTVDPPVKTGEPDLDIFVTLSDGGGE